MADDKDHKNELNELRWATAVKEIVERISFRFFGQHLQENKSFVPNDEYFKFCFVILVIFFPFCSEAVLITFL